MPENRTTVDVGDIGQKVTMCLSLPRVTWTANFSCVVKVAEALGIRLGYGTSAYWSASLEYAMAKELLHEKAFEFILTVDNDSVFGIEEVLYLYALIKSHPEIDAIAALEMKREESSPLLAIRKPDGTIPPEFNVSALDRELVRVAWAHFGLTLIRTSALRDIPRPWFLRLPKDDGSGESTDDDMYFWKNWEDRGKSLYVAAQNPIGHIQEFVTWPGRNMELVHQSWGDYEKSGKPQPARPRLAKIEAKK